MHQLPIMIPTQQNKILLTVASPGLLSNDTDADGDDLEVINYTINATLYNAGDTANLAEGDITINADGSYTYEPSQDFLGNFPIINYTISDGTDTD